MAQKIYLGNQLTPFTYLGSTQATSAIYISTEAVDNFINATGITDSTQISAVTTLYTDLYSAGLISKFLALYPLVGGNATAHSYNLINTAQYQLSFNGGWTHNANGITGNGTNTFADTGLNPVAGFAGNNSLGVYVRNNVAGGYDFGAHGFNGGQQVALISRYSGDGLTYLSYPVNAQTTTTDSRGLTVGQAYSTDKSIQGIYKNGVKVASDNTNNGFVNFTDTLYLGAINAYFSVSDWSTKNYAIAFIGRPFTSDEQATLYTIIQSYQTTLSRQV